MKVLSLMQPWATLVVLGVKKIETRSWSTAYRGPLLIHASRSRAGRVMAGSAAIRSHIPDFSALPFGAIIGQVMLRDVLAPGAQSLPPDLVHQLTLEERAFGDYAGRYWWILDDAAEAEEYIPATGRLGLWEL